MASNTRDSNKKRQRPRSSWVWTYFDINKENSNQTACKICGANLPYASATNTMASHLRAKHNIRKDFDLNQLSATPDYDSDDEVEATNNKLTPNKKIKLDNDIIDFITQTDQSISIIEHPSFLKLISDLSYNRYNPPCRRTLSDKLLPNYVQSYKRFFIKEFQEIDSRISLTGDCWTSISCNSYIGVTAHFVSKNWKLTKRILALRYLEESKTTENLFSNLVDICKEYSIHEKLLAATTDSGADIVGAVKKMPLEITLPCACHRFNLTVNDIFKIVPVKYDEKNDVYSIKDFNESGELRKRIITRSEKFQIDTINKQKQTVNDILSKCRGLVGSFKHSSQLQLKLKQKQIALGYKYKIKLIQDVCNRWNSTYDLLDSICCNKDALVMLSLERERDYTKITKNLPDENEFKFIDELCELLYPLKQLTNLFSGQTYCTVSLLFPAIFKLIHYDLPSIQVNSIECNTLREILIKSLTGRFNYILKDADLVYACTMLDFRMKHFSFIQDKQLINDCTKRAKNFLKEYATKYFETNNLDQNELSSSLERISSSSNKSVVVNSTLINDDMTSASQVVLDKSQKSKRQPLGDLTNASILNEISILNTQSCSTNSNHSSIETNQNNNRKRVLKQNLSGIFDKQIESVTELQISSLETEIDEFLSHKISFNDVIQKEIDEYGPFYFFKQFFNIYPILTKIAKSLLAIPAASVPAESLFSQSGLIATEIRNRLTPDTLENLTFLKENKIKF